LTHFNIRTQLTNRLRAWIDQPLQLLYFESRSAHDTDADAQGTAGGLGIEREEKEIEPVSWTERWDDRIRDTSSRVSLTLARAIQVHRAWLMSRSKRSLRPYRAEGSRCLEGMTCWASLERNGHGGAE
jgi:hypothetical protein